MRREKEMAASLRANQGLVSANDDLRRKLQAVEAGIAHGSGELQVPFHKLLSPSSSLF